MTSWRGFYSETRQAMSTPNSQFPTHNYHLTTTNSQSVHFFGIRIFEPFDTSHALNSSIIAGLHCPSI